MTTLNVNTIQDTSASNSSTPAEIVNGRAKAWVTYDGSTNNIRSSYNVSSVTDNATGDFTINFDNKLSSANYSYTGNVMSNSTSVIPRGVQLHRTSTGGTLTYVCTSPCNRDRNGNCVFFGCNYFGGISLCCDAGYTTLRNLTHTITPPTSSSIRLQVTDAQYNGLGSVSAVDAQYVNFVAYE